MKKYLDRFVAGYISMLPYSLIATGVVVGIIFFWWLFSSSKSETETKAIEANTNAVIANVQSNVQERVVVQAAESVESTEKTSQGARKQREKAKQANVSNSSYAEANAERCKTFPESSECK
jgi:hypothetical protein